jgi:hypothetical protein
MTNNNNNNNINKNTIHHNNHEPFMSYISADVAANNGNNTEALNDDNSNSNNDDPPFESETPSGVAAAAAAAESSSSRSAPLLPPRPPPASSRNVSFGNEPTDIKIEMLGVPSSSSSPSSNGSSYRRLPTVATSSPTQYMPALGGQGQPPQHRQRPTLDRQALSMRLRQAAAVPTTGVPPSNRITLDDLLQQQQGKYETEAETNIIMAFEQKQQFEGHHIRDVSNASTIFSSVPDRLALDMVDSHDLNTSQSNESDTVHSSNRHDDSDTAPNNNNSHALLGSSSSSSKQESQSLLTKSGNGNPASVSAPAAAQGRRDRVRQSKLKRPNQEYAHRRLMSVEDQLAGLHFAMAALEDHHHLGSSGDLSSNESTVDNTPPSTEDLDLHHREPDNPSAGDLLGHHAGLLLDPNTMSGSAPRRPRANTDMSLPPVLEESKSNINDIEEGQMKLQTDSEPSNTSATTVDDPNNPGSSNNNKKKKQHSRRRHHRASVLTAAADKVKDDFDSWQTFFRPRKEHVWTYLKRLICYTVVPFIGIAAILYYLVGNPATGKAVHRDDPGSQASASWWLLFVVRQFVTFSMSLGIQALVIDFLCVGTRAVVRLLGPILTLLIVQSKGWPFVTVRTSSTTNFSYFGNVQGSNTTLHTCLKSYSISFSRADDMGPR